VQAIADDLGFDGALGTVCEVVDGAYTGKAIRALHAQAKADCIRSLDHDLARSTAYSDSHTDLPFLEAVGKPVAVNPDRALRKIARQRGWPVMEFGRGA
jgi:phosphoserine phosphatase